MEFVCPARRELPALPARRAFWRSPAYQQLLAAEPFLRRAIPTLTIFFLLIVAAARIMSLMAARDDIEWSAGLSVNLATAQLASELSKDTGLTGRIDLAKAEAALQLSDSLGTNQSAATLVVMDTAFNVAAARGPMSNLTGKSLESMITESQPLFMFGAKAGAMPVKIDGRGYLVALHFLDGEAGSVAALQEHRSGVCRLAQDGVTECHAVCADVRAAAGGSLRLFQPDRAGQGRR